MKTQILQLEPHDDVISTRDKIGWGQARRILLVWPLKDRILTRRLDLQLLLRHSDALNAQLALVTRDAQVRDHANSLGVPVFKSVRQAQTDPWRRSRNQRQQELRRRHLLRPQNGSEADPSKPELAELQSTRLETMPGRMAHPGVRVAFFILGLVAFLSIAAVLYPGARIELAPETRTQDMQMTAQARTGIDSLGPSGIIPAQVVNVIVEGRDSLETSGTTVIPDRSATGLAVFTNLTGQAVEIQAGTVVRSLSPREVQFTTRRTIEVPPGPDGRAQVAIRAIQPGTSGNLPADSVQSIEGPLVLKLTVTNLNPTSGGTELLGPAPRDLDRRRLYNRLLTSLRETAAVELESLISTGDLLLSDPPVLVSVLEEVYEPADVSPADQLSLLLRLEFSALVARQEDLHALVNTLLNANLQAGHIPLEDSLNLQHLTAPQVIDADLEQVASWQIRAERKIVPRLIDAEVINLSLGLTPDRAAQRLADELPLNSTPEIQLSPAWWPRLPLLPFRIQVIRH